MDRSEHPQLSDNNLNSIPKLPVWIIEYAWAHNRMDICEAVDPSLWPEVDPQLLTLKDSWRLRVASAQAYSIMKRRDIASFERVMAFLEATHKLLPRLVVPIKHMKIMFGLKTMVIMWMLKEGRGLVDTVTKTIQFFPSKLPQYQDHCSQQKMLLMRKNHVDFKALAQTLAMDKDKLDDYIKTQMEEQYGEHYAQRLEERLLHYLLKLETLLPKDTYIDKLLKKEHPLTMEEKLLLEVITCDSKTIETSLNRLLHCDAASCGLLRVSQNAWQGAEIEIALSSKAAGCSSSSKALLMPEEVKTPLELQAEVMNKRGEGAQDLIKGSPLLLECMDVSETKSHQQTEEKGEDVGDGEAFKMVNDESDIGELVVCKNNDGEEKNVVKTQEKEGESTVRKEEYDKKKKVPGSNESSKSVQDANSPPQFCSRHQRWVRSILWECPDECSEELLCQADGTTSPTLFLSSSSTSSLQDLTPSLLIPPVPSVQQKPPSQMSTPLQTGAKISEQASPMDKPGSGTSEPATDSPQTELLPQLTSSHDTPVATLLTPMIPLINIASVKGYTLSFQSHDIAQALFTISSREHATATSHSQLLASPLCCTSRTKEATLTQQQTLAPLNPTNTTYRLTLANLPPVVEPESTTPVVVPVSEHPQDQSTSASCLPPTKPLSRLSRKFRQPLATIRHQKPPTQCSHVPSPVQSGKVFLPLLPNDSNISGCPTQAFTSSAQSRTLSLKCTTNQTPSSTTPSSDQAIHPQQVSIHQAAIQPQTPVLNHSFDTSQSRTPPCSMSDYQADRPEGIRADLERLRLSLQSQAMLLQSKLLQPYVRLTRLSQQEYHRLTKRRSLTRLLQPVEEQCSDDDAAKEEEETENQSLMNSLFDPNSLYSSQESSCSTNEDSQNSDPDFIPYVRKKKKKKTIEWDEVSLSHN